MSLIRLATRIAATRALRGATLAEDRVFDSDITPLDAAVKKQPLPFLMVLTETHRRDVTGRDLSHGEDTLELVIEAAIAARATFRLENGDTVEEITTPNTDAGLEFTLDMIEAQVSRALTDQHSQWSTIFCGLVPRITSRVSRRGAGAENGLRFAARQIIITCDTLADPIAGQPMPEGVGWSAFLAACAADPELNRLGRIMRSMIDDPAKTDWQMVSEIMGLSAETVQGIGMGPVEGGALVSEIIPEREV